MNEYWHAQCALHIHITRILPKVYVYNITIVVFQWAYHQFIGNTTQHSASVNVNVSVSVSASALCCCIMLSCLLADFAGPQMVLAAIHIVTTIIIITTTMARRHCHFQCCRVHNTIQDNKFDIFLIDDAFDYYHGLMSAHIFVHFKLICHFVCIMAAHKSTVLVLSFCYPPFYLHHHHTPGSLPVFANSGYILDILMSN